MSEWALGGGVLAQMETVTSRLVPKTRRRHLLQYKTRLDK